MPGWVTAGGLAVSLGLSLAAAAVGGRFRPGAWYAGLRKSALTPPPVVFPVVWSLLYAIMAIAVWWVWRQTGLGGAAAAIGLYLGQLLCNALWSWLFFGLKRPVWALLDIALLWVLLVATTVAFFLHSPFAGALLLPYLAWASFAAYLNGFIVWHN